MTPEHAEKKTKISLTNERPALVLNRTWRVIAKASEDTDHNNQELARRYYLRVRQHDTGADLDTLTPHADGRLIVYGWHDSSYRGEPCLHAGYRCTMDDIVHRIRQVGEEIGAPRHVIGDCIADLPEVVED